MEELECLIHTLLEKRKLFSECEQIAETMSVCQAEEMEALSSIRQELIEQAQQLDLLIRDICARNEKARFAVNQTYNRNELSGQLAEVYDASLSVKAVADRILQNEDVIRQRICFERDQILEKIESMNQSGTAVAAKYQKSSFTGVFSRPIVRQDKKI